MVITTGGVDYIDGGEIARLFGLRNASSFYMTATRGKTFGLPFPKPDLQIGRVNFWRKDREPELMEWRNRYLGN